MTDLRNEIPMQYSPLPDFTEKEILEGVFSPNSIYKDKSVRLFSAAYTHRAEFVVELYSEVLRGTDNELKLCVLDCIDSYVASRQTLYGLSELVELTHQFRNECLAEGEAIDEFLGDMKHYQNVFGPRDEL